MSVKIRLRRTGGRNDVCYRVVAADTAFPRDGRFIEVLGWYDPKKKGENFHLEMERIEHWTARGAQCSDTVASLLRKVRKRGAAVAAAPEPAEVPAEVAVETTAEA
jgi:small subunit ribosomal protein S16